MEDNNLNDNNKIIGLANRITSCVTESNRMYFRGRPSENGNKLSDITKHDIRRVMRENKQELRQLKHLLNAKNYTEIKELADHIRETFPDENLSEVDAENIANKLQGLKLRLPPSSFQKAIDRILLAPRLLYAVTTELISGLAAGVLGILLWKANLDPKNPITEENRPPILRVHGLMDTQGSSLPMWMMQRLRRKVLNLMNNEDLKYGSGYSLSYAGLFYNNPKQSVDDYVDKVADKLMQIREDTGHERVILQGHSMGGLIINRLAQLQDEVKELKNKKKGIITLNNAKELRAQLITKEGVEVEKVVEPKIHDDFLELANMSSLSENKKNRAKQDLMDKLERKGIKSNGIEDRINKILNQRDEVKRNELAKSLADDVADKWFLNLLNKIDPEQSGMKAKWLITICTPYDGSKLATGSTKVEKFLGITPPKVHELLKKRSLETKLIGADARKKVELGERRVYEIACKTNDPCVSEGSAKVNYDSRYSKVYKTLAHLGALLSPRVADDTGAWLDEIYKEVRDENQPENDNGSDSVIEEVDEWEDESIDSDHVRIGKNAQDL